MIICTRDVNGAHEMSGSNAHKPLRKNTNLAATATLTKIINNNNNGEEEEEEK